ncbi:MAG: tRNA (adenosine(37)-N6)-threonylcarbamoyltransferase complex ATPase subunit type 1 TsaE [Patescibacteria group bacterium]
MIIEVKSKKELDKVIKEILKKLQRNRIFLFIGELGTGKTTIIKKLAKKLNIKEVLTSPTFILWQKYEFKFKNKKMFLNHLDLYRVKTIKEILNLDLRKEIKKKENYFFIEWGEKIKKHLKKKKIKFVEISIKKLDKTKRIIEIK